MIEVDIENFQSIEKVSLKIEGFTALVGRSNIGKSAIARAIKYALTGATGNDFVRHGPKCERRARKAKKCRCKAVVSIRTSGVEVLWKKGDEDNSYQITRGGFTQEYSALDRGDQEFLKPEFQQVVVGDSKELLQVTEQFEPIFLLNKTGGVVADVLSDVAQLDDVNEAIRLAVKDRKDAVSTRSVREKDTLTLRKAVDSYGGLDNALASINLIESDVAKAEGLQEGLTLLQRYIRESERLNVEVVELSELDRMALPDWDLVSDAGAAFMLLHRLYLSVCEKAPVVRRLSGIESFLLPEPLDAQATLDRYVQVESWMQRLSSVKDVMTRYQAIEKLPDLSTTDHLSSALAEAQMVTRGLAKLTSLTSAIATLTNQVASVEESEKEILAQFADLDVCPTCTQGISPEHLHLGGL